MRALLELAPSRGHTRAPTLYAPAKTRICDSKFHRRMPGIKLQGRRALEELIDLEAGEVVSSAGLLLGGREMDHNPSRAMPDHFELASDDNLVSHSNLTPRRHSFPTGFCTPD